MNDRDADQEMGDELFPCHPEDTPSENCSGCLSCTFTYKPLNQNRREIRVLRFQMDLSDASYDDASFSLRLEHISRDDMPDYVAISYVWGSDDPKLMPVVKINGDRHLRIGRNLDQALRQLYSDGVSSWIWVDAICINQCDEIEKSWQVNDMKAIFEQAMQVYIWLGPAADDSDFILERLETIGSEAVQLGLYDWLELPHDMRETILFDYLAESFPDLSISADDLEINLVSDSNIASLADYCKLVRDYRELCKLVVISDFLKPPDLAFRVEAAMGSLLLRDLWHRAWIFQEIAVAKDALFVCGTKSITIECFEAAIAVLNFDSDVLEVARRVHGQSQAPRIPSNRWDLQGLSMRRCLREGRPPSLIQMLLSGSGLTDRPMYSATDPRDLIYSLLGVTNGIEDLGLIADYRKSVAVVYSEAMRAFVTKDTWQGLYLLAYATFPKTLTSLPSWVPDWSQLGNIGLTAYPIDYAGLFNASGTRNQPYGAMGIAGSRGVTTLRLSGAFVTTVSEVLAPLEWEQPSGLYGPPWIKDVKLWLSSIRDFAGCTNNASQENWASLRRAVLFNEQLQDLGILQEGVWGGLAHLVLQEAPIEPENLTGEQVAVLRRYRSRGVKAPSIRNDIEAFAGSIILAAERAFRGRTLFRTAEGALGLGPKHLETADSVVIVSGMSTPIVLRERGDESFEYVGDAYIDGMMYGEFLETNPPERLFDIV